MTTGTVKGRRSFKLPEIRANLLHCSICFEQYTNPRCLPCLHSFCYSCLSKYVKNADTIRCPSCNQTWDIPDDGIGKFPPNYLLNDLLEIIGPEEEVEIDRKCQICNESPQCYVCVDCVCCMCDECTDHHRKLPAVKEHRIFPLEEITQVKAHQHSLIRRDIHCKRHNKIIGKFCNTCEVQVCESCIASTHRSHTYVPISAVTKQYQKLLSGCLKSMKTKLRKYEKVTKRLETSLSDLENTLREEVEAVETQVQEIIDKINQEKEDLIGSLERSFERELDTIRQDIIVSKEKQQVIGSAVGNVNDLIKYGTPAQIVASKPLVEHYTIDIDSSPVFKHSGNDKLMTFVPVHMRPDTYIGSIQHAFSANEFAFELHTTDTLRVGDKVYGSIKINCQRQDQLKLIHRYLEGAVEHPDDSAIGIEIEPAKGDTIFCNVQCKEAGSHKVSVKLHSIDVKGSPCYFSAKSNRDIVPMIESEDTGMHSGVEISLCCGIAIDKKGKVLLADGLRRIQKYNYDTGKGRVIIEGKEDSFPQFIAVSDKNEYFVTDMVIVSVYDRKGKHLTSFGKGYLDYPMGIGINNQKGLIFVANKKKHTISVFTVSGDFRGSLDDNIAEEHRLVNPYGVAVNSKECVIVSDRDKHCIQVHDSLCKPLFVFGCEGSDPGQMKHPEV
ncbi:tripartite motif-containing protein 2-like [Ptychodera flava]|uniref:tripartite motif-containing protein 2-like n=1 Tax=Ptychodera flava TaxID=63121 RepID=UPI00396A7830